MMSFSTLVRICPSSDSATRAGTLDRPADWPSRSRDRSGVRDWTPTRGGQERQGYRHAARRWEPPSRTARFRGAVVPAIMAVYRPDQTRRADQILRPRIPSVDLSCRSTERRAVALQPRAETSSCLNLSFPTTCSSISVPRQINSNLDLTYFSSFLICTTGTR